MFLAVMRNVLGKDVYENPGHTTCTGIGYHTDIVPFETTMTVVARQFALMTEAGYKNYAVSCITSFGLYTEILDTWNHHPEIEARIREHLKKATGKNSGYPKTLPTPATFCTSSGMILPKRLNTNWLTRTRGNLFGLLNTSDVTIPRCFP